MLLLSQQLCPSLKDDATPMDDFTKLRILELMSRELPKKTFDRTQTLTTRLATASIKTVALASQDQPDGTAEERVVVVRNPKGRALVRSNIAALEAFLRELEREPEFRENVKAVRGLFNMVSHDLDEELSP